MIKFYYRFVGFKLMCIFVGAHGIYMDFCNLLIDSISSWIYCYPWPSCAYG